MHEEDQNRVLSSCNLRLFVASWLFVFFGVPAVAALAQQQPQPAQQQAQQPQGLDALNDDALMNELAARGLDTLLDRAFEVNHVPPAERTSRRALLSLARLADPSAKISASEREQLVSSAVKGIESALGSINDPNLLMRQAFVLITQGVERDVNTLEYWGENARTQANLHSVVLAVCKLLDRAAELARSQADEVANKITSENDPDIARYEKLDRLASTALYTRNMVAYYLALSLDRSDPQRRKIADDAIGYLKQFDVPENPDRAIVRNRMAKLAMTKGDFAEARKLFASVINDTGKPGPTIAQQYEARYFTAVADLLDKKPQAARKGLDELLAWQESNLPSDKTARDGAAAAASMLRYRIESEDSKLARSAADKKKHDDAAVAVLMDLLSKRPDLRGIISEQLLPRIDDNTDLKTLGPLLLRALVSQGEQQIQRPASEQADKNVLQRAIEAAREIIRRRGQSDVDQQMVDASSLLVPFFLQRLDRKAEAANAFIDYADQYKISDTKNATLALNNAQALIGQLRASPDTREDPAVTRAYERFLPLAIAAPFSRREFAFEYARRLQLNDKPKQAVEYYRLVPDDDKRLLEARYLELVALHDIVSDEPANSAQRPQILADIQKLADQVNTAANTSLAQAKNDADRNKAKSMLARTSLLAADLARREGKDPARAISLLASFEQTVKGLPDADQLVNDTMFIRVQSYMQLQKYTDATAELVKLLNKTEGAQGAQIVYNLLQKLNADFDRAQQANDRDAMQTLARSRAQLSGFLVKWAAENKDPNIRKFTYRYKVFDAETQRRAAELEDDPNVRTQRMKEALERYKALESPDNLATYRASLDDPAAANDPNLFDPQVAFAVALIQYDLGQYESAAAEFTRLLAQRKLGTAVISTQENGQEKLVDNDQYWEAILKLIRCDMKLNQHMDEAKDYLKQQYITWGDRVGGRKWKSQYEALRTELIPDFKVESLTADTNTPPTTQE